MNSPEYSPRSRMGDWMPHASAHKLSRTEQWLRFRRNLPLSDRLTLAFTIARLYRIRSDFAARHIRGAGYEIGAQNSPLACPHAEKITYIDYLTREDSAAKYNLSFEDCVEVDILADAGKPDFLPKESASFLIANHVLEHCPNPIATLAGWIQILEPGGVLFLTLPNYLANEFDFQKQPTTISHMLLDYQHARNNRDIVTEHVREHVQIIDGINPKDKRAFHERFQAIVDSNLHTHYHVFNRDNILDLLHVIHTKEPIRIVDCLSLTYGFEHLFIIKKGARKDSDTLRIRRNKLLNGYIVMKHLTAYLWKRITRR